MIRLSSLLFGVLFSISCFSQNVEDKYADLITAKNLHKHLSIIASAEMQGREAGTEGERKAAAYIIEQLKKSGVKALRDFQGYKQHFPLYRINKIRDELIVGKYTAKYGNDYIFPLKTNRTLKSNSNQTVFIGYGIDDSLYSDYKNIDVKGKTVVFFLGAPLQNGKSLIDSTVRQSVWSKPEGLTLKLKTAQNKGAVNALILSSKQEAFSSNVIELNKSLVQKKAGSSKDKYIPHALISQRLGLEILGDVAFLTTAINNLSFDSTMFKSFDIKVKTRYYKNFQNLISANVIGYVEGSDKKDEFLIISAHYDHLGTINGNIYYGADDDGSGTVALIELANAFSKAKAEGNSPRRTVVFIAFSGEEKGLLGSYFYSENPALPFNSTTANLNIDMIGRIDTERKLPDTLNYVYVVGHNKLSSELPSLLKNALSENFSMSLDYKFDDPNDPNRIYYRSDHYNFARKGVPVLFFYDGMLKADYHKPSDTVDKINWALYEKRARFIFYVAWDLANRENMLLRDLPLN